MSWLDAPEFKELERYVSLTAYRQSLVAGNIANIDTPHYHTLDIDFQKELQRASAGIGPSQPQVHMVQGLVEAPNGNNVSMDRESMLLAQTQLEFRLGIQLLRNKYHMLQTAITEGK